MWIASRSDLERSTIGGYSPVRESLKHLTEFLSRMGHAKSCLKLGGPPSKAKYELMTDSEQVP